MTSTAPSTPLTNLRKTTSMTRLAPSTRWTRRVTFGLLGLMTTLCFAETASAQPEEIRRRMQEIRRRRQQQRQEAPKEEKAEAKKVESWIAIRGGDVYRGDGTILRRATVLIADDKIKAVGLDVEIPEEATILDATGKVVSPGFCILSASGMGPGRGQSPLDGANPFDPTMKLGLAAGITSYLWSSGDGGATPGGNTALVKLSYGDLESMVAVEKPVVSMRLPLNPQDMRKFRELVEKADEYLEKRQEVEGTDAAKTLKAPNGTEELLKVMQGEQRLWLKGAGGFGGFFGGGGGGFESDSIRQGLEIAQLLGTGVVFEKPTTAWVLADEIAATGSMVIDSPRSRVEPDEANPETTGSNIAQAAILNEAGIPVGVVCPGGRFGGANIGLGGILGQDLNTPHVDAAYAVRGGLPNRQGLRLLTLDAAKIMNVADRVGSIEPGKDADILILDGDPLHYRTFVQTALVNGKVVYEKDKESFYRDLD